MLVDKNNPSSKWIEHLRRQFPCEPEVDRVSLTARCGAAAALAIRRFRWVPW